MKNVVALTLFLLIILCAKAQENPLPDSLKRAPDSMSVQSLEEVVVEGFEQNRNKLLSTATVRNVRTYSFYQNNKTSLVHAFNTAPGVRMEERSPGSYRINIRGSSLRSPFGVRNVKVYWNGVPFTDPGGNTYFNQFAFNNFSSVEVFNGPAGSLYGAGTGGLILINTLDNVWLKGADVEYITGSYGLHNLFASVRTGEKENRSLFTYAHNEQDGYRVQSAMRRDNFSWSSAFKLNNKQELRTSLLFTDMYYQTPGGLTKAEFDKDPKAARPAAGAFPSAEQARAAIYQKNILAAVQHRYQLDTHWSNTTVLYAAYAQIKNPAVRNYERRSEPHAGGRSSFTWQNKIGELKLKFVAGGEYQHGFFNTQVFSNRQGNPDTLQTDDDIDYDVYSIFVQGDAEIGQNWFITAGASLNQTKVTVTRLNARPITPQRRTYRQEWSPRISVLRRIGSNTSAFAIVSKGFSPPSMAELLPSTGVISTGLEAETGWNYEAGLRHRFNLEPGRVFLDLDASAYYFKLENTLVQRRDIAGADFFINAGDTRQKGIELSVSLSDYFSKWQLLDHIFIKAAYTYSHFRYGSFTKDTIDFSGNMLPSVPAHTFAASAEATTNKGIYATASYYYAAEIFLNDANTAAAEPYHLLGVRLGYQFKIKNKPAFDLYAGADNLLNQIYSLGNDINDPRGRYYNTAPRRNFYAGGIFRWGKQY